MKLNKLFLSGLVAVAGIGLSTDVLAGGRNPGSLLLYPEFDNTAGDITVLTVTNVLASETDIEFVYIGVSDAGGPVDCEEFNRTTTLTGNDTLTLLTKFHNPQLETGYVYVFAKSGGLPVSHDGLIGSQLVISGIMNFDYSVNPVSFKGIDPMYNDNGLRDLDGNEYGVAPGTILIPRFFGQGGTFDSKLILIGLTGGAAFDTKVDFKIYNDNEEMFSGSYTFHCWEKVSLMDISGVFDNAYLANNTNDDPDEIVGAPTYESGWMSLDGAVANSNTTSIDNPAIYAVLIEEAAMVGVADLPFEDGENDSGSLLARSNNGEF